MVSIQDMLEARRKRIQQRNIDKRNQELKDLGIKDTGVRDTQGNIVTDSGTVSFDNGGDATYKPSPPPRFNNGGSGGKVYEYVNIDEIAPPKTPPPLGGGGVQTQSLTATREDLMNKGLTNVKLNRSGTTTVGTGSNRREYTGNAYINELGMTANQYKNKMREYLISQGTDKKNLGGGRYSVKTQTGTEDINGEKVIYNAYGEAVGVESKIFGQTLSIDAYNKKIDNYNNQITSEGSKVVTESNIPINPNTGKPYSVMSKDTSGRTSGKYGIGQYDDRGNLLQSGGVSSLSDWTGTGIRDKVTTVLTNQFGFGGKVVNELVPKTALGVAAMAVFPSVYKQLSSPIRAGISGYFAFEGTKGTLNKELTPEQRVASGIAGGLGVTGLASEMVYGFTPKFSRVKENSPLDLFNIGEQGRGRNKMSDTSRVIVSDGTTTIFRNFVGTGVGGESISAGSRVVAETPLGKFFGKKPYYSGNPYGETIVKEVYNPFKGKFEERVIKISREQAQKDYSKSLKFLKNRKGLTESQAKDYIRRSKSGYEFSKVDFSGTVGTQFGGDNELTRVGIQGVRKTYTVKEPVVVDLGNEWKALTSSKGGKTKVTEVISGMDELKTIIPKGVESGGMGELTFFKGSSQEFNPLGKLGKRITKYQDVAVAKKTGQISFGDEGQLGTIEYYKTGSISKDITYGTRTKKIPSNKVGEPTLPKGVTKEVSNIEVINPAIRKTFTLNKELGTAGVETFGITSEGTFGSTAKIEVPIGIRETPKFVIEKAIKIEKTPLSKTFGSEQVLEQPKPVLKTPRPTQEAKVIAEETSKLFKSPSIKSIPKAKELKILQDNLPLMVGGEGLKVIPRSPSITGNTIEINMNRLPSQMEGAGSLTGSLNLFGSNQLMSQNNILSLNKNEVSQLSKTNLSLLPNVNNKSQQKNRNIFVNAETSIQVQPQDSLSLQKEAIKQSVFNLQAFRTKQLNKNIEQNKNLQKQYREINKPIEKIIKYFDWDNKKKVSKELSSGEEDLFKVYGRRFGKFNELGTKKSKEEAEKLAKEFSLGTLGASTYIEKSGKKIESNLGTGFRKSKSNPFIQVQDKGKRLESYGEKREIKSSRRKRRLF